jgi:hypothetical protein
VVITRADEVIAQLAVGEDIAVDLETNRCELTDAGIARCEELLGVANIYADHEHDWSQRLAMALRARALLRRDRDYVVVDGAVRVVDELTGRIAEGRNWSDGLQQAVEAKEGVGISHERRALARITVGSYFLAYDALIGMSGTLEGAEEELQAAYAMSVVAIPPDRAVIRRDAGDADFADGDARAAAVADDIERRHAVGQPVLVGTLSIAQSVAFSDVLRERGIEHRVLTARNDAEEADIIAGAGRAGAVTVATQMAGRGVDIVLDDAARANGGLMIWGLEHHSSRRLDMQLRGRSGRQGDPGETRFGVCPTDEIATVGQDVAERLDEELRATVRAFDGAVDEAQERMHAWRRRSGLGDLDAELDAAVSAVADELTSAPRDRRTAWIADINGLDLAGIRRLRAGSRRDDIAARLRDVLDRRRDELGGDEAFAAAARATLVQLQLVLWADELDGIESEKLFARIPLALAGDNDAWRIAVHDRHRSFIRTVQHEWIVQLSSLQLGTVDASPNDDAPALPVANTVSAAPIDAPEPPPAWEGFSFNRWVRNHFGVLLNWEPPVVLALDAVGDTTASKAARVRLDLDDPGRSVVELLEIPGAQSHERPR